MREHRSEYSSPTAAAAAVARQERLGKETVRRWAQQAESDAGHSTPATADRGFIDTLRSEGHAVESICRVLVPDDRDDTGDPTRPRCPGPTRTSWRCSAWLARHVERPRRTGTARSGGFQVGDVPAVALGTRASDAVDMVRISR